jgi:20S proteasome alpha/beta subunit
MNLFHKLPGRRVSLNSDSERLIQNAVKIPLPCDEMQMHGTTTLAFKFGNDIIIGVDSRASVGSFVGSSETKKILPVTSYCVATMAGGAADCSQFIRHLAYHCHLFEIDYGSNLTVGNIARRLSQTLTSTRGAGMYEYLFAK